MKNSQLIGRGILHAVGIMAYCGVVAQIISNGDRIFGQADNAFTPVVFLMLLTLSAAVVGSLIFGKPVLLYSEGKKPEAIQLVGYTLSTLAILTLISFVILVAL